MLLLGDPSQTARPEFIGPYRIESLLGEGGMGVVYRATHRETGAAVALKTVSTSNGRMLASIRREVHALSRLRHPGVVRVVDEGVERSLPWYAMELLEGLTLRRFAGSLWNSTLANAATLPGEVATNTDVEAMRHGHTMRTGDAVDADAATSIGPAAGGKMREVLRVIRRLCVPLAYLHGEGIVHRDLKPENVFILHGGQPVLVDFGLVSNFEGSRGRESLELAGTSLGTPAYMAPEQIRGEVVDARADLYALGCLLFELVTGRVPFTGHNTMELVGKHLLAAPAPPSSLVTGIDRDLDALILRLLAKNPRDRIGHALDVAQCLIALGADPSPGYEGSLATARPYLYRPGFTGRDDVFRKLREPIDRARHGHGSLVLLGGESGVGKTRLATEVGRIATSVGHRVVACECTPLNVAETAGVDFNGAPLHPFSRFFEAVADRCLEYGAEETARMLGPRAWVLLPYAPALREVPGLAEFAKPAELSAEASRQRLFRDLAETIANFVVDRPCFLLIDDLQWADELTLDFLDSLQASYFEEHRIVMLCTWRVEEATPTIQRLVARSHVTSLTLGRMDEAAVGEIVSAMLAMGSTPRGFVEFLARQSEGNPFFVAEYLRTALAEGLLTRDANGHWRLADHEANDTGRVSFDWLPLPRSVRELVTRRLDGLPDQAGALALIASVVGREVDGEVLRDIARVEMGADDDAWHEALRTLLSHQVLDERAPGQFRFIHDRLREIAYARIEEPRREALHRRVAETLEARYAHDAERAVHSRVLAHHWTQAAVFDRAIEYLDQAGTQALDAFANHEAKAFFEEVLALQARIGHDAEALRMARWERSLAEANFRLGHLADGRVHAERALASCGRPMPRSDVRWVLALIAQVLLRFVRRVIAPARTPPAEAPLALEAARVLNRMLEVFLYNNDPLRGVYCGIRTLNVAESLNPSAPLARGYAMMSIVLGASPLRRVADVWAARALTIAEGLREPSTLAYCLSRVAVTQTQDANWTEADQHLARAIEISREVGDQRTVEECRGIAGVGLYARGAFEESRSAWSEVFASARSRDDVQTECWSRAGQAQALVREGRAQEALTMLEDGMARVDTHAASTELLWVHGVLSLARLQVGDRAGARNAAEHALEQMKASRPVVYYVAPALAAVTEVLCALAEVETGTAQARLLTQARHAGSVLHVFAMMFPFAGASDLWLSGTRRKLEGRHESAIATWRKALAVAQTLGTRYEEARLRVLLARYDRAADSRSEITQATKIFQAIGASHDLGELRAGAEQAGAP